MVDSKVDFFFVGFPKSGSTTFYYLLKAHPEIFSPDVKEFNFFNSDHNREAKDRLGEDYFQLTETEQDYARFFQDTGGKIKGDFTPINIFSQEAPQNIFRYNPAAKILISVREPVSFLRSFHFQSLYNMVENEPDFLKALSLEEARQAGRNIPEHCYNPSFLFYSILVEYQKHIKRYTDIFGYERIKILLFDDIVENESKVYREILEFLSVTNSDFIPSKVNRNPSHALRFLWLRKLMFNPPIKKWLYKRFPKFLLPLGAGISQMIFKKVQEKPFVSSQDIGRLKIQFRPNVLELNSFLNETGLLDRDLLTMWGY